MNARWKKGLLATAASCLTLFALAGSASAASITSTGGMVKYNGLPSETSNVSVNYTGISYEITDSTAVLNAGTGCTKSGLTVTCAIQNYIWIVTGDQDDSVTFTNATPATTPTYIATKGGSDIVDVAAATGSTELQLGDGNENYASGGSGNDNIVLADSEGASHGSGGYGDDTIQVGGDEAWDSASDSGGSSANGGPGNDLLTAFNAGGAILNGEGGNDTIMGSDGADHVELSSGSDSVESYGGDDLVEAWPNTDGADTVDAGDGDDKLYVWPNTASVDYDGGAGTDQYSQYYSGVTPFRVSIDNVANDGGPSDLVDNVRTSVENVVAVAQYMQKNDHLVGSSAANKIVGGNGNDYIDGQGGSDVLQGGTGLDWIDAVDGSVDTITCGTQSDTVSADTNDNVASDCENVTRF